CYISYHGSVVLICGLTVTGEPALSSLTPTSHLSTSDISSVTEPRP
ncbi:unnamed protein product, partial [marine sediment metagenome]